MKTQMLMAMALPTLLASWADSAARQPNPPPKIVPIPRFRHLLSVPPEITSKISDRLKYIVISSSSIIHHSQDRRPSNLTSNKVFSYWRGNDSLLDENEYLILVAQEADGPTITQIILWSCQWLWLITCVQTLQ